jgi:hypothetical protein
MMAEIKKKYKNLTQEVLLILLKFCGPCQTKLLSKQKGLVIKPIIHSKMNSFVRLISVKQLNFYGC